MKNWTKLALSVAAGAAAGVYLAHKHNQTAPAEPEPVTAPDALLPAGIRYALAEWTASQLPERAAALVMSDDRSNLAHDLSPRCRMIFSSDGAGAASAPRAAWPENIIRADCDLQRLWMARDSLDAAVLVNALQRYEDPQAVLAELRRVLKPEGRLILCLSGRPDNLSPSAWCSAMAVLGLPDRQAWQTDGLRDFLQETGWRVEAEKDFPAGMPLTCFVCRSEGD